MRYKLFFLADHSQLNANLQGADIAIIAGGLDFLPDKLITRPEIKSSKDLKGVVTFGITSFGTVTELATRMALDKLDVNSSQITIVQTGGSLTAVCRVTGGSIQGTVMFEPLATWQ